MENEKINCKSKINSLAIFLMLNLVALPSGVFSPTEINIEDHSTPTFLGEGTTGEGDIERERPSKN